MKASFSARALAGIVVLVPLWGLLGCSGNGPVEHAECTQGATRQLACGKLGAGLQAQRCGDNFRWTDEGSCVEHVECDIREERSESCGGLNGRAMRSQTCDLGQWPASWGACIDPDECKSGATDSETCTGEEAGVHGRAQRDILCVDGAWERTAACVDPDHCSPDNAMAFCHEEAACVLSGESYLCRCNDGFEGDGLDCTDIDECASLVDEVCDPRAVCENNEGSYLCHCAPGLMPANDDPTLCIAMVQVSAGAAHTCSINEVGALFCWGSNQHGQLGFVPTSLEDNEVLVPRRVKGEQIWRKVAASEKHSCGLTDAGDIYCWGDSEFGKAGQDSGSMAPYLPPTRISVSGLSVAWTDVAVGSVHSCGVTSDQKLYCWGRNHYRQLGQLDSVSEASQPQLVPGNTGWAQVSAGSEHTCGTGTSGVVRCWGRNSHGQSGAAGGSAAHQRAPVPLAPTNLRWARMDAGQQSSCAVGSEGRLSCIGQIVNDRYELTDIFPEYLWAQMGIGVGHYCARTQTSELFCWGDNAQGQLGLDDLGGSQALPMEVDGEAGWESFTVGFRHTCGIREGRVYCWGQNNKGQVGDGSTNSSGKPTLVVF